MPDDRLRAVERLVAAGELPASAALALRDRVRGEPLLPVPVCFGDRGYGGLTECQVADGGACLGWGGEFGPLPTAECPLPPWALARRVGAGEIVFAREDGHGVLRRELVTGARVLVADRPCERCGGWKFEDEPTDDEITCGACDGTGAGS